MLFVEEAGGLQVQEENSFDPTKLKVSSPIESAKNGHNTQPTDTPTFHIPKYKTKLNSVSISMGVFKEKSNLRVFMFKRVPLTRLIAEVTMLPISLKVQLEENETHSGKRGSVRDRNEVIFKR